MRCLALSLILPVMCPVVSFAQCAEDMSCHNTSDGNPPFRLYAQRGTVEWPTPRGANAPGRAGQSSGPYGSSMGDATAGRWAPATNPESPAIEPDRKASRWSALGRGLANAARVAVAAAAVTAATAVRAYGEYTAPVSGYGSTYSSRIGSTYRDACAHGYTEATCPYGYNGGSYGSTYLSGSESIRTRPDGFGNYRYYTSDGRYGSITRDYSGGYRVTNNLGNSITASAGSLRSMGYRIDDYGGY